MTDQKTELRYLDLKYDICKHIYKGTYIDGGHIPSERQLAADYNVSRITVRKALELMEEEQRKIAIMNAEAQLMQQRAQSFLMEDPAAQASQMLEAEMPAEVPAEGEIPEDEEDIFAGIIPDEE